MNTIGKRIKDLRIQYKLTQEELAKRMGYTSRSTINKIEKDLVDLPQSKVSEFAKVLKTSPEYLIGWENTINFEKLHDITIEVNSPFQTNRVEIFRAKDNNIKQDMIRIYEKNSDFGFEVFIDRKATKEFVEAVLGVKVNEDM